MKTLKLLVVCLMLNACAGGPVGNSHVPEPAKAVDLDRYVGKWYELARYENRFERDCEGVTAEYTKRADGLIAVLNTCRQDAVNGAADSADGKARIVDGSGNAKLRVSFFWPFYGDYWVLDRAEDYSWSIVGEPSGRYLWILARKPVLTQKQMSKLIAKTKALGYDTSLLRMTKQPPAN